MGWRNETSGKNQAWIFPAATEEWMLTPFGGALPIFPKSGTKEIETACIIWCPRCTIGGLPFGG